jgi:hypothetical protein
MSNHNLTRRQSILMLGAAGLCAAVRGVASQGSVGGGGGPRKVRRVFEFSKGAGGMLAGFSDFALSTGELDLIAEVRPLPPGVSCSGESRNAYYLEGNNHPDDLFMFLKGIITESDGLIHGQGYLASFDIEFASNNNNCVGVGGSEASVFLKAGGTTYQPVTEVGKEETYDYVSINVDKGNQAQGGRDLGLIGSIWNGIECPESEYRMLRRTYKHPTVIYASRYAELWIALGTDSGYESVTGVYYYKITVDLIPV